MAAGEERPQGVPFHRDRVGCGRTPLWVLPAWKASDAVPEALMTAGREVTETRRSGRIHRTLVAAEVALGTVLAIGSGLVLISLHHVLKMPTGFESESVSLVNIARRAAEVRDLRATQR